MVEREHLMKAGHYFLAIEGLALARNWLDSPDVVQPLIDDVVTIVNELDQLPHSWNVPVTRYGVEAGYTRWAPRYDGPNPAIEAEEPIVRELLGDTPRGTAVDAACGTGRHSVMLAELGYEVIGVDATEAMLELARPKVPDADFRLGRLEALPVDDGTADLVTCGLALTHVDDLGPVISEFGRVLRPGGELIISDIHPVMASTGGAAAFPTGEEGITVHYVPNLIHQVSEYISAFTAAGLTVVDCIEPTLTVAMAENFPSFDFFPDATRIAYTGLPYLLIWRARKEDAQRAPKVTNGARPAAAED